MRQILLILLVVLTNCQSNKTFQKDLKRWQKHAERTTIIRDGFGVPHIYGTTDADAVFGLLYAQCEDDFNRVEQNYIWATGRLAELEGEEALYSDLRAKLFMTEDEAMAHYENSPQWLKKLCEAFADGINYYLHTHPEVTPRLITRFEPWMPMYFSEGSIGGDIERVSTSRLKNFYEDTPEISKMDVKQVEEIEEAEPQGSNGIALSGSRTASGTSYSSD
jgi:acyl-homoserine-lactone acylase